MGKPKNPFDFDFINAEEQRKLVSEVSFTFKYLAIKWTKAMHAKWSWTSPNHEDVERTYDTIVNAALWAAAHYDPAKGIPWTGYCTSVIKRSAIRSLVHYKNSARAKHRQLTGAVSCSMESGLVSETIETKFLTYIDTELEDTEWRARVITTIRTALDLTHELLANPEFFQPFDIELGVKVVSHLHGIDNYEPLSLAEMGRQYGLSRQRMSDLNISMMKFLATLIPYDLKVELLEMTTPDRVTRLRENSAK